MGGRSSGASTHFAASTIRSVPTKPWPWARRPLAIRLRRAPFPARLPEPEYGSSRRVRRVQARGQFSWKHEDVFLRETLIGECIALEPIDDRWYTIYFAQFALGQFDSRSRTVHRLPAAEASTELLQGKGTWSAPPK